MSAIKLWEFDKDVMVDTETLGKRAGCPILSIGACTLDGMHVLDLKIEPNSNFGLGLISDASTVLWWEAPERAEARKIAFSGNTPIIAALEIFADWYRGVEGTALWGLGADFDKPILEAAFALAGIPVPWKYNEGRCFRTLRALYPQFPAKAFTGVKHSALADAENQAAHCYSLLKIHATRAHNTLASEEVPSV